ncbi:cytochrome P450 [Paenarthrobacter sp. NPDC091711]|uniref:cytochrome P450 n=1 Tax=Paenarthrobacter sp. NPDC091711 TaxID=3364385 RepID=UPI00381F8621
MSQNVIGETESLSFFPMDRGCPFAPPPELVKIAKTTPTPEVRLWNDTTIHLLTKWADIRAAYSDSRFSANDKSPGYPRITPSNANTMDPQVFLRLDPPQQLQQRRMVTKYFTANAVQKWRPHIEDITAKLIAEMRADGNSADLVADFAAKLPAYLICDILGVPRSERPRFQGHAEVLFGNSATPEEAYASIRMMENFLRGLLRERQAEPRDDLISQLVQEQLDTGNIDERHLGGILDLLLNAGHDTTASMIAMSMGLLLQDADAADRLRNDETVLATGVEELIRMLGPVELTQTRVAVDDVEVGGQQFHAGDGILPVISMANRDPEVFENPDTLQLDRKDNPHLSFGYGTHQCLGQNLARLELQIILPTLLREFPTMRLAIRPEDIVPNNGYTIFGIKSLPVVW